MSTARHVTRTAWIKRRARRLMDFYSIHRREAVINAWSDWANFHTNNSTEQS